jgi:hypothetical protein
MQKEFPEAEVFEIKKVELKSPIIKHGRDCSDEIKIFATINCIHER